ncbi:hypothetical protein [Streptomyces sp. NPDC020983]|uniref:hypothetical protein n=1 Tax=Streptomyces sp. NPDC020983 TaxID=3365106 RepID=UPI0037B117B0
MTDYRTQAERDAADRFARETAKHQMTVLHDDGLHRHLRFANPGSSLYWFEITTTPGQLVFSGDGDSFVFRLAPDMFEMFRQSADSGAVNASYWAEKVRTGNARSYSRERFEEYVEEQVAAAEPYYPGIRDDVQVEIFDDVVYDVNYEASALMAALGYAYFLDPDQNPEGRKAFNFKYVHEWDLRDFDWWYLFACHAIVWGIAQYDAAKTTTAVAA